MHTPTPLQPTVLVVEDEARIRKLVAVALGRAGYEVTPAVNGREALERVAEATPDLIVSDVTMPQLDGFGLVARLRDDPATRAIPVILLTAKVATEDVVAGLDLGADDYLPKPFLMPELLARVRSKLERPPVPNDQLPRDRQTGLLTERLFMAEVDREVARVARGGTPGCLAYLYLDELPRLRERLGSRAEAEIAKQVAVLVQSDTRPLDLVGRDAQGRVALLLPETDAEAARRWLDSVARRLAAQSFTAGGERVRLTPTIGFAPFAPDTVVERLRDQALAALDHATAQLDLRPVCYTPAMEARAAQKRVTEARAARWWRRVGRGVRLPLQIAGTQAVAFGFPFLVYAVLAAVGVDITHFVYLLVVAALLITAYFIWVESFLALRVVHPPDEPPPADAAVRDAGPEGPDKKEVSLTSACGGGDGPSFRAGFYPPASAIIAAYLPNEAATIVATVEALLRVDYAGPLQVILAYNTPRDLPVEALLQDIARRDARFLPLRVDGSTSKSQNVNRALAEVTGAFVGVFDADLHPEPDSFTRAWRWLSHGYDVVQGHCVIRNGDDSWVARLVAVEFELIYALSHPGRARLHGFGIFGGANGYWKTDVLRRTRLYGSMLTEDIDASMRLVEQGYRIISDPFLIARELAPVTLKALWHQRMRWAQGWFQVSLRHLWTGLWSHHMPLRQKPGFVYLLGWREVYAWLSVQMAPILAYWLWRDGPRRLNWLVPLFVLTSIVTLLTGPMQTVLAYLVASPEMRRRRRWFIVYGVLALLFYTGFKNLITRVAQVKEAVGERRWVVTPRAAPTTGERGSEVDS